MSRYASKLLVAALLAASCGGDFDPGSRVTSLRVLVVQVDAPFAKPGETVQVQAQWHRAPTDVRKQTWAWATCVNPESSSALGCMAKFAMDAAAKGAPPSFTIKSNDGTTTGFDRYSLTVPQDALSSLPAAAQPGAVVGIVLVVCPGTLVPVTMDPNSFAMRLPFDCLEDGTGRVLATSEFETGVKRVFVRAKDRNANPVIGSVQFEGQDWPESYVPTVRIGCDNAKENRFDRCLGKTYDVRATVTTESFEKGEDEYQSKFEEQLVVQYYATEGLWKQDVRTGSAPETKWAARADTRGDTTLWIVARDNRGGVTWTTRHVTIEP